ncbi:hypothetical protein LCGC14_1283640 [marine sediment metagenome]|uniref:Uncharacterized protein n=1 Tax=marine sediment metagenome TaxID=412755 RepID=A0A0F9KUH3_9ZZZZ
MATRIQPGPDNPCTFCDALLHGYTRDYCLRDRTINPPAGCDIGPNPPIPSSDPINYILELH